MLRGVPPDERGAVHPVARRAPRETAVQQLPRMVDAAWTGPERHGRAMPLSLHECPPLPR
jgi:hypothetical protein